MSGIGTITYWDTRTWTADEQNVWLPRMGAHDIERSTTIPTKLQTGEKTLVNAGSGLFFYDVSQMQTTIQRNFATASEIRTWTLTQNDNFQLPSYGISLGSNALLSSKGSVLIDVNPTHVASLADAAQPKYFAFDTSDATNVVPVIRNTKTGEVCGDGIVLPNCTGIGSGFSSDTLLHLPPTSTTEHRFLSTDDNVFSMDQSYFATLWVANGSESMTWKKPRSDVYDSDTYCALFKVVPSETGVQTTLVSLVKFAAGAGPAIAVPDDEDASTKSSSSSSSTKWIIPTVLAIVFGILMIVFLVLWALGRHRHRHA